MVHSIEIYDPKQRLILSDTLDKTRVLTAPIKDIGEGGEVSIQQVQITSLLQQGMFRQLSSALVSRASAKSVRY